MILLLNYMVSLGKFILSHSSNHHLFTEDSQSQITRSKTLLDSKPACTSIYISKWMLQAHMSKMEAIFFSSKPPSSQSLASLTLIRNFKSFQNSLLHCLLYLVFRIAISIIQSLISLLEHCKALCAYFDVSSQSPFHPPYSLPRTSCLGTQSLKTKFQFPKTGKRDTSLPGSFLT